MKHYTGNNFAAATKRTLSAALILSMTLSPLNPAFATEPSEISAQNIGRGDMATAVPTPEQICKSIDESQNGEFLQGLTVTKASCAGYNRRRQGAPECQEPISLRMESMSAGDKKAKADQICSGGPTGMSAKAASYCAIRQASADGQAKKYCDAYYGAKKANRSLGLTLVLDASAAGLCWMEHRKINKELDRPNFSEHALKGRGPCAKASMLAGLAEFVHASSTFFGDKGPPKLDSDGNEKGKFEISKVMGFIMKAGLSAKAIQIGICSNFEKKFELLCGKKREIGEKKVEAAGSQLAEAQAGVNSARTSTVKALGNVSVELKSHGAYVTTAQARTDSAQKKYDTCVNNPKCRTQSTLGMALDRAKEELTGAQDKQKALTVQSEDAKETNKIAQNVETGQVERKKAEKNRDVAYQDKSKGEAYGRLNSTRSAAIVFTALAVLRGSSMMAAKKTERETKEILQSMFAGSANTSTLGNAGAAGNGINIYTAPAGDGTFNSTRGTQPIQNEAIAAGSPESFLLPPGAEHTTEMQNVARQIPADKAEQAASGGAAGLGGLIASIAGPGASEQIRAVVNSAYANLPKEESGYSGGGGALASAKSDGGAPDLNLKSLFGEQAKEEGAVAENELAYRTLAAEDIWHSQNPRGNNLFQIVSEKYETVQRKSDLAP